MASVVAAAPIDGAPPLALLNLDLGLFGAAHTLKVVIGRWLNHCAESLRRALHLRRADGRLGRRLVEAEIYRLLPSLLAKGVGIITVSSYLPEVYELADALHVFRAGGLVASHGHKDAAQETILTETIGV